MKTPDFLRTVFLSALILLSFLSNSHASLPLSSNAEEINSESAAIFFDRVIQDQMEKHNIPGLSLVLVNDTSIIYQKGYGLADVESGEPVDPGKSVFYAGSVSKLFTATAVMQLYEKGLLDLDDDVNEYLEGFRLDDNFNEPVRIKNLLTHTTGIEERISGMAAMSDQDRVSLLEFLSSGQQPRVEPPGNYISYSNYAYTLLGYMVECVSGISFGEYINQNIFSPLGMENSGISHEAFLYENRAKAYFYRKGEYTELEPIYLNIPPAGSLMSTASDISRFMMAQLGGGQYQGNRILGEETVELMHSQLFTHHPLLAGWCHGFTEQFENDIRYILHPGDIYGYSSLLALVPDQNIGFYLCINGSGSLLSNYRETIMEEFADHFFPALEREAAAKDLNAKEGLGESRDLEAKADLKRYQGSYRMNRYSRLSFEKLTSIILQARIRVLDDRSLAYDLPKFAKYPTDTLVFVEPLLFRDMRTDRYAAFYEDENGRITHLNVSGTIPANFEKVGIHESPVLHLFLMLVFLLVYLHFLLGWPLRNLFARILRRKGRQNIPETGVRRTMVLSSGLNLGFILGFGLILALVGQKIAVSIPWPVPAILTLPFISIAAFILLVGRGIRSMLKSTWNFWGKFQFLALLITNLVFFWFLDYWNLLGFKF